MIITAIETDSPLDSLMVALHYFINQNKEADGEIILFVNDNEKYCAELHAPKYEVIGGFNNER